VVALSIPPSIPRSAVVIVCFSFLLVDFSSVSHGPNGYRTLCHSLGPQPPSDVWQVLHMLDVLYGRLLFPYRFFPVDTVFIRFPLDWDQARFVGHCCLLLLGFVPSFAYCGGVSFPPLPTLRTKPQPCTDGLSSSCF